MPISKEEDKIHKALMKSQEKILNKMAQIEMDIHHHHGMHGGDIGIVDAFKNLGNTIKSGFEDKVINPIKSGFEEKIINPIENKIINPVQEQINSLPKKTQDLISKIPDSIKDSPQFQKTLDFLTKKKGGLASSLLHNGLPAATSAIVGGLSTLASGGNPLAGMAGSTAGGYAGKELSDYIGRETGVGLRKMKGKGMYDQKAYPQYDPKAPLDPRLKIQGKGVSKKYIVAGEGSNYLPPSSGEGLKKRRKSKKYYSSSSSDSDSDFRPKRRTKNSALRQLLVANKDNEDKELKKSQLMLNRHLVEEVKAIRGMRGAPPKFSGFGIEKIVGTKKGNRARGDIVAEVMKKEGLSLSQASKYVKEHDMY